MDIIRKGTSSRNTSPDQPKPMYTQNNDTTQQATLATAIDKLADKTNLGVADRGALHEVVAKPRQIIFSAVSTQGAGVAAEVDVYITQEDLLNETPTNNGSGAGTVTKSYNDGFGGNLISQIIQTKGEEGLRIKQLQITYTITSTGNQNSAAINATNPRLKTYNGDSSDIEQIIPIASAGNPMNNQDGFLIVDCDFTLKRYSQLLVNLDVLNTLTVKMIPW